MIERNSAYQDDDPQVPEEFITMQQFLAAHALPDSEAEFLIRAAADDINRFYEKLGEQVPGIAVPFPIHRYVHSSAKGAPVLYFSAARLHELLGQVHEDTRRLTDM